MCSNVFNGDIFKEQAVREPDFQVSVLSAFIAVFTGDSGKNRLIDYLSVQILKTAKQALFEELCVLNKE